MRFMSRVIVQSLNSGCSEDEVYARVSVNWFTQFPNLQSIAGEENNHNVSGVYLQYSLPTTVLCY